MHKDRIQDTNLPQRCPTCGAPLNGALTCSRCKTNLGPLAEIARNHRRHMQTARRAFADGNTEEMFIHARRGHGLRRTPESMRLLACAALLTGRFELAASCWATGRDADEGPAGKPSQKKPSVPA